MTNEREITPPPNFSTPPQIQNNTTSGRPPVTTIVFAATTPENTPFAYRASTSANLNPMISPAFVEANYEVLESLLRERQRQIRNEDLRTKLEYFSEDYDEERKMEPRPEPHREATPTLRPMSPMVRRQRERVVGFEEAPNREGSKRGRNAEGIRPSEIEAREDKNRRVNLPPPLAAHLGRNERKTLKDRKDPLGSVTEDRKAGIGSPHTEDLTMDCSLTCPKAQERSSPQKRQLKASNNLLVCLEIEEAVNLGSYSLGKRSKEAREGVRHSVRRMEKKGKDAISIETPILMIKRRSYNPRKRLVEGNNSEEEQRATNEEHQVEVKDILSCVDTEERIVVNDQYPEQTIAIGRQLPTKFKIRLQDLLRVYVDVFAWITAHMTGVPRTILIGGKAFNTEHRVNELKHLEPVKQKKRSLTPERNKAIHTQVEDLANANIL
uniref:Reverse transcriptase domain-containing protein n=1 Tax=Tanacetum cinerariifolium TaxID=118510 RepID=A0A6L2MLR7_TANCI|nr:hypothetical protein [Tanacetum cinerariifolium]